MLIQTKRVTNNKKDLTFRPPALDDLTAVVDLLNDCAVDQTGLPNTNRNQVLSDWTTPAFDLAASVRIVETVDNQIVGYIEVWDNEPIPISNWVWGRVHPEFEGRGIGTELMMLAEWKHYR